MQVDDGWLLQLEEDDEPLSQGPQMGKESPGQGHWTNQTAVNMSPNCSPRLLNRYGTTLV